MRARLELTGITCHNPEDRFEADLFYLAGGVIIDQHRAPVLLSPIGMRAGQFRIPWPNQSVILDTDISSPGAEISIGLTAWDRDLAASWGVYDLWLDQLATGLAGVNLALGGDPRNAEIIHKVKKVVSVLASIDVDDNLGDHTNTLQVAGAPVQETQASFHGRSATGTWSYTLTYRLTMPDLVPAGLVPRHGGGIQLMHHISTRLLHSHPAAYQHPGTSGQQQVTGYEGLDDNNWWTVHAPHGHIDTPGEPIHHGQIIRLQHAITGRNLHSHRGLPSPVTNQQEVTCFGDSGNGDANDNWRVEVEGGGLLESPKLFRLVHEHTGVALHSHHGYTSAVMGHQQEVTGYPSRDGNDFWRVFQTS